MQNAQPLQHNADIETLNRCCLVVDGNGHRPDLIDDSLPENFGALAAEAMLPQIRTTALMIAASRHDTLKVRRSYRSGPPGGNGRD